MHRWGKPQDILQATGLEAMSHERVAMALITAWWRVAAGESLAARLIPVSFADGILSVAIADPRWQQALPLVRRRLLGEGRRLFGIKNLSIAASPPAWSPETSTTSGSGDASRRVAAEPLPGSLRLKSDGIRDPELRDAFRRAAAMYLSRARSAADSRTS